MRAFLSHSAWSASAAPLLAACQLVYPTDGLAGSGPHDSSVPGHDAARDAPRDASDGALSDGPATCDAVTTSDPANCGSCGHDCQGGGCEAGACQPVVLATGQPSPAELAVDDAYVYWVNFAADGGVMRVKKDGTCTTSACAVRLANGGDLPVDIAIDDGGVYWVTQGQDADSVIRETSKAGDGGGAVVTLARTAGPSERLVVDDTAVYWANALPAPNGTVYSIAKTGAASTPTVVATGQNHPGPVAVDDANIYWVNEGTLDADKHSTDGAALTVGKLGTCVGSPCPLPLVTNLSTPFLLKVDATSIYWSERSLYGTIEGASKSVPRDAGTSLYSANLPFFDRVDITLGGDDIFFNYRTAGGSVFAGNKNPATCPSTCPHVLATDQSTPQGIAVDTASVYWTDFISGQIMKVAQ